MQKNITPLPWEAFTEERFSGWHAIRQVDGSEVGSGDGGFTEEDAAFIVKACNSHDELVAKIKAVVEFYNYAELGPIADARKLIAKLEAK